MQGLIPALQTIARKQSQDISPKNEPPFGGFTAKIKLKSSIAEVSEGKCSKAYIDSGAIHHFFHNRSVFSSYTQTDEEPVKGVAGITKIVGKGLVQIPNSNGMIVDAYHSPAFSSNILAVCYSPMNSTSYFRILSTTVQAVSYSRKVHLKLLASTR